MIKEVCVYGTILSSVVALHYYRHQPLTWIKDYIANTKEEKGQTGSAARRIQKFIRQYWKKQERKLISNKIQQYRKEKQANIQTYQADLLRALKSQEPHDIEAIIDRLNYQLSNVIPPSLGLTLLIVQAYCNLKYFVHAYLHFRLFHPRQSQVWFSLQQSQELENTSHNVTSILCLLAQCTANEERETTTRSHECSIECTRQSLEFFEPFYQMANASDRVHLTFEHRLREKIAWMKTSILETDDDTIVIEEVDENQNHCMGENQQQHDECPNIQSGGGGAVDEDTPEKQKTAAIPAGFVTPKTKAQERQEDEERVRKLQFYR